MAVETNSVHSAARRGHEARASDRAGTVGAGKLGAQAPQPDGFLGLLSSLQAEDVDGLSPGQTDTMASLVASWGVDTPQSDKGQVIVPDSAVATLNLAGAVAPSWSASLAGASGQRSRGQESIAKLGNGDAGADLLASSLGQRKSWQTGEETAAVPHVLGADGEVRLDASFVVGAENAAPLADTVAGKTLGKGGHGKSTGTAPLQSTGVSGTQSPVAHWSKSLGDTGAHSPVADGGGTQLGLGRQSSPSVGVSFREMSAAPRPELATTALFGGAELRQQARDEFVKTGREAVVPAGLSSETESLDINVDAQVLDPANTAAAEEDPAKYWIGGEGRHSAELKVDEMAGGPVEISIQLQGNEATIAFKADGQQAQDALLSGSRDLEKMLGQEGMVLSGLSVGTSGAHGGGQSFGGGPTAQPYGEPVAELSGSKRGSETIGQSARRPQGVVDHFV